LIKLGYIPRKQTGTVDGKSYKIFKRRCEELGIDRTRFIKNITQNANKAFRIPMEEILVENSTYTNITKLKDRLVKEGYKKYVCEICGNAGIWDGEPLSLELHHINGNHFDHRLENLQFLCPNCHTQIHYEEDSLLL